MGVSLYQVRPTEFKEIEDLVRQAQAVDNDDTPAMNELLRRFEPLVLKTARRTTTCHTAQDDIANDCRMAVVRAVRGHEQRRPGFAGYVRAFVRGEASRSLKRLKHNVGDCRIVELVERIDSDCAREVTDEYVAYESTFGRFQGAVEALTTAQRRVLRWRYIDDLTLGEIAARCQRTESAISQRLSTIHRLLRECQQEAA